MPATLLVLDIDGTLRPHGEPRVPKENVDALRTVQKAGVKLVIATGRCRAENTMPKRNMSSAVTLPRYILMWMVTPWLIMKLTIMYT